MMDLKDDKIILNITLLVIRINLRRAYPNHKFYIYIFLNLY